MHLFCLPRNLECCNTATAKLKNVMICVILKQFFFFSLQCSYNPLSNCTFTTAKNIFTSTPACRRSAQVKTDLAHPRNFAAYRLFLSQQHGACSTDRGTHNTNDASPATSLTSKRPSHGQTTHKLFGNITWVPISFLYQAAGMYSPFFTALRHTYIHWKQELMVVVSSPLIILSDTLIHKGQAFCKNQKKIKPTT